MRARTSAFVAKPLPAPDPGGRPFVRLKHQEDRRLRRGHLWVFSNEIDQAPAVLEPGSEVEFLTARNESLGIGYYNPHSLIAGRLMDRREASLDVEFFSNRLRQALDLRERMFTDRSYRWVYGESDDVPGLVIDRYDDVCVMESFAAGIDRLLPVITEAVRRFGPWRAIVLRNDASSRRLEKLPEDVRVLEGSLEGLHWFNTDGIWMAADPVQGQKTGYFFDQRPNRKKAAGLAAGRTVLDVFCHTGGFSHYCAGAGAVRTTGVDLSAPALDVARGISEKNGFGSRSHWQQADAFEFLGRDKETYDIVVIDPPRFASAKKTLPEALRAYIRLFGLGLKRVKGGGFLAASSCSQHVSRDEFRQVLARAAYESHRKIKVVDQGGAGPDHPVRPAMPETEYLKFALLWVS